MARSTQPPPASPEPLPRSSKARARVTADNPQANEAEARRTRRERSLRDLVRAVWALLRGHRRQLGLALLGLSVATAIGLIPPAATKVAIDYILTDNPGPEGLPAWLPVPAERSLLLWMLCGALVVVAAAELVTSMAARWKITRVQKRLAVDLRRRAFAHAVRLPLHRALDMKAGGVASLLRQDAGSAGELLGSMLAGPWRAIIRLLGTLTILAFVDPLLLVGALLILPVVALSHRTWIARIRPLWRQIRRDRSSVDAGATEAFSGLRVVRAFGREGTETRRFAVGNHVATRREIDAWWRMRAVDALWALLVPAASAVLLLYGGGQVLEGNLTLGDLMMFSTYLLMLLGPIEALVATATQVQNGLAGLDRVLELLDAEREAGASGGDKVEAPAGRLTLDHVSFAYPAAEREVLTDIDLDIAPGETVALVGPSGAGKTTLTHLVARFYDPAEGAVRLDGRDLRELDVQSYRRLLAVVEQDVFLFDGTVAENIAYGRPEATEEEIWDAAERASARAFIEEMEHGLSTRIGERGVRLSGGQRQRLAIARALLADPRILILDEATSNLDAESEARIQEALDELLEGRTCFIIAHRLSTVRTADRVVVLDGGAVVEVGTHEELIERGGRYAQLLAAQLEPGPAAPTAAPRLAG